MTKKKFRLLSSLGLFGKDEDGHISLYLIIMLPAIIGLIGLTLDGGALFHLHTDQQELADAAALAGAKELDGRNDAITRATDKAQNLLSNNPRWSNTSLNASAVQITTPTFYSSINPDVTTTDPTQAYYIKVTTVSRERQPVFIPVTAGVLGLGATPNRQSTASATAGATSVACQVQPLMLCNPLEGTSDFTATPGQLFHFKQKGSTGGLSPGDFGLVDPPGVNSSGSKTIRNLLSQQSPNLCYVDQLSPRPGQAAGDVADGINVRFDITPNGNTSGLDRTPAPTGGVIKGIMTDPSKPGDACKNNKYNLDNLPAPPSPASTTYTPITGQLPLATDMTNTPPTGVLSIGNTMDMTAANAYWQYHHGANWPTVSGTPITRFAAYCRELGRSDNCQSTGTSLTWVANTEPHAPQCAGVSAGDYKRRLISVAVVNCQANNVQGNQATNLRSNHYAVFFLTNPSPTSQPGPLNNYLGTSPGTNGDIMAEFVGTITPAGCTNDPSNPFCAGLHQVVQLYR